MTDDTPAAEVLVCYSP